MRQRPSAMPKQLTVRLGLPMVGEVTGVWEPVDAERRAAWELYVELVTRVSVVELKPGQGLIREAFTSLYSLFGTTRDILRRYGPEIASSRGEGQVSFGSLAVTVLNSAVRPLLAEWHPRLAAHENARPEAADPQAHEQAWEHLEQVREELEQVRRVLTELARTLAGVAGSGDLLPSVTSQEGPSQEEL